MLDNINSINKVKILVVEDDNDINNMLTNLVRRNGYEAIQAYSGTEAALHLKSTEFNLVLLDIMIPGMDGKELLTRIRKTMDMPVIVISARIDKTDKIEMLNMGADDYITKPFDIDELSARINSNLRRYSKDNSMASESRNSLSFKDITLNKETKEVLVNGNGVNLTAREFIILELFLSNPKKVFSKANLFESVWGEEYMGDDNTVNVHMSNLRGKLQKCNKEEEYIETIWGMGYKLKL
ncbi:DNA-binding response OmpR family regulator [Clostridium tetanomorphum]|uniref:response regulator transcription factor n=1 Tax=Clostridium tetanomorphum TaxID=1553 RepID=UPI0004520D70|nr:response regulator transcription factor [Clostridium tetanomorphum]KAJ50228.1 winged helix family two component transcriptional regulator [Clostridium tetanomorphum DSM 665]MBP1864367.1 DNA-binding response OmpR family regulator [Clostridium tetanomorphum]NRS83813.1 DNA-binding response OmpR family regulator [Clostridium tetanomorphum]SQC02236.1 winged helix family two component transcriptional regulator [Clostridium tetanomorphum]